MLQLPVLELPVLPVLELLPEPFMLGQLWPDPELGVVVDPDELEEPEPEEVEPPVDPEPDELLGVVVVLCPFDVDEVAASAAVVPTPTIAPESANTTRACLNRNFMEQMPRFRFGESSPTIGDLYHCAGTSWYSNVKHVNVR